MSSENQYLQESLKKQAEVEALFATSSAPSSNYLSPPMRARGGAPMMVEQNTFQPKITGFYRWKKVIVPPNVFVVHTRLGKREPLNCGLGISFNYNPYTDSFLTVPAAMQTILINANCICKEKQGVVVQAYIQWSIEDFSKAYLKLDFSNRQAPMNLVNTQLKEQAEASIKDAVATMGIEDILTDKQPIIQSLTERLRQVANGEGNDGLGIRIVTVQIKEAIVSSPKLWDALQRPFRAEREKIAQMAEIEHQNTVHRKKEDIKREQEELKLKRELEEFEAAQRAKLRRVQAEAENAALAQAQNMEAVKIEFAMKELKSKLELELKKLELEKKQLEQQIELDHRRALLAIEAQKTAEVRKAELYAKLPEILGALPQFKELRTVTLGPEFLNSVKTMISEILNKSLE
jgi:flotillin